jgi:hypothetical protein
MSLAGMFTTKARLTPIDMATVVTTYNGLQGCACGCGGDYFPGPASEDRDYKPRSGLTRRVNLINANLDRVERFDGLGYEVIYELADPEGDRVTRVYFEEGRP